jgi:hypothetical protein
MGRWSTGAQTTAGAQTVELSYLVKHKFLQKGQLKFGQPNWSSNGQPTGNIGIECRYFGDDNDYIRLHSPKPLTRLKPILTIRFT